MPTTYKRAPTSSGRWLRLTGRQPSGRPTPGEWNSTLLSTPQPTRRSSRTAIVLVTLITAPIGGSYFAVFEASRLDHLYGTLPLRRAAAEAGIYAHTAILVAVNGLLASLAVWVIGLPQHLSVSSGDVVVTFALSFVGACVYIGLLYPVYLAVPFSTVYILTNVPFYVVTVGIVYVAKRTDWFTRLASVAELYHDHPGQASARGREFQERGLGLGSSSIAGMPRCPRCLR
jgi:hypothetical protein